MADSEFPNRKTDRLRLGRKSATGAIYFLTCVTAQRVPWLKPQKIREQIRASFVKFHRQNGGELLTGVVMPDHVHLIVSLDGALTIGQWVARFKSQSMRATGFSGKWQRDFWEHRIRPRESIEDYGLYVFLNPYRAELIGSEKAWPGWWSAESDCFRFQQHLHNGVPPKEWVRDWDEKFSELQVGE
ncbi:MAG: hypothetical protein SynsKO_30600 [Synoicihabitans sp.]